MNNEKLIHQFESKLKVLKETAWQDSDLTTKKVQTWYKQFNENTKTSANEQVQFLFLLSQFMYFGKKEMDEMLVTLFRDLFKFPILRNIRKENNDTFDSTFLNDEFAKILERTRFIGIGNPSESGSHLLYSFRTLNKLSKSLFISENEILKEVQLPDGDVITRIRDENIDCYIFFDDLTCSGSQAMKYSSGIVKKIKEKTPDAKVYYFVLVATKSAIELLESSVFDKVDAVIKLDESFKCFNSNSRYYGNEDAEYFDRLFTKSICEKYDQALQGKDNILGFDRSQLLLSFYHNTPDNVPPIFWSENNWSPAFKRSNKIY